jgi:hypothetical protein
MCASCGWNRPNDNHGDQRNITLSQLQSAVHSAHVGFEKVIENMRQTARATSPRQKSER